MPKIDGTSIVGSPPFEFVATCDGSAEGGIDESLTSVPGLVRPCVGSIVSKIRKEYCQQEQINPTLKPS